MNNSIYKEFISSKDGYKICVLQNGKTIDSRYNALQSCKNKILNVDDNTNFFIVTGLSSGIVVKLLFENFPNSKILVLEINEEDFLFLKDLETVQELANKKNIIFTTLKNLKKNIINYYLPSIYGSFKIIEQSPWLEINSSYINEINSIINSAINEISADYSVQSHFGKIWMQNILRNLKSIKNLNYKMPEIDLQKKALIVAAGPSLNSKINWIKKNRNSLVIFSTDTAYQTLRKEGIYSEFLVSIDGQNISHNHFYKLDENTTVLIDFCGNCSVVSQLINDNQKVYFFSSNHPFCSLINYYTKNSFPVINSGSGTVTIAALDIAVKLGYKSILVAGADFSYPGNKPYTNGTYLDQLYLSNSNKISTFETNFSKLLFRTDLIFENNIMTTKILKSYKESFINYLFQNNLKFTNNNFIYTIDNSKQKSINFYNNPFIYDKLIENILSSSEENITLALLPLIANLRKTDNNKHNFDFYRKLALSFIVRYN